MPEPGTTLLAPNRIRARLASPGVVLALIIAVGAAARTFAALERVTPRYFPDEFLYTQLATSLARGDGVSVMGQPSSFPALLEPLLTSVFWRTGDAELAMALTKVLHGVVGALAAIPVYTLARRLRLSERSALLCAASAVLAPGLFYAAALNADAVGYLVALLAIDLSVRALLTPTWHAQALAIGTIGLATFDRLQYAVLGAALVLAALWLERGRPLAAARRYPVVAGTVLAALGAIVVAGPGALGRYEATTSFRPSLDAATWLATSSFLLMIAVGVVVVPGAVAWLGSALVRRRERADTAFASLTVSLLALTLTMTAVLSVETASDRFIERYLIVFAPLAAVAFAAWLDRGRPAPAVALVVALLGIVAVARIPLSGYSGGQGAADSPTLIALTRLEGLVGVASASLLVAALTTVALGVAAALAYTRRVPLVVPVVLAGGILLAATAGAHLGDRYTAGSVLRGLFKASPTWVDDADPGAVTLVHTQGSSRIDTMLVSIWNTSVRRLAPLGTQYVEYVDGLGDPLHVRDDGVLVDGRGRPMRGAVLFGLGGTAAVFDEARVAYDRRFALVEPAADRPVRLAVLAEGIRYDGKVTQLGHLRVFPTADGRCGTLTVRFTVPDGVPPTTLELRPASGPRRTLTISSGAPGVVTLVAHPDAVDGLRFRTVALGDRPPTPFDATVANARFTAGTTTCAQGSARDADQ